jgi:hypothetical protein
MSKLEKNKRVVSKTVYINKDIRANVEIHTKENKLVNIMNRIHSVKEKNNDSYTIFHLLNINKCFRLNRKQSANILCIQLLVCYDRNKVSNDKQKIENMLLYQHHCFGDSFLASKLIIFYKDPQTPIEVKSFFFKDLCKYLKSKNMDILSVLELETLGKNITEDIKNYMMSSSLSLPNGYKSLIIDVSKDFAVTFLPISDKISEFSNND